jgi:exonuclease III
MILMTLNIRGVGGTPKLHSLRRILIVHKPDILFLQETLVNEEKARHFLTSLCPSWMVSAVSSVGNLEVYWWLGIQMF